MNIDLSLLHRRSLEQVDISGSYEIDSSYYENSDVIRLGEIVVNGYIYIDDEGTDSIKCDIDGEMIIHDAISLEEVSFPYSIKYDDIVEENCKNGENSLDIFMFLWENIVLEVPLRFTKVKDLSKFHGDGWRLISEDELVRENNPFNDLLKNYDK